MKESWDIMIKQFFKENSYYKAMLAIAVPVSIQSLFGASLSIIDQIMIGKLGDEAIAAVGLGMRFPFMFIVTLAAVASTLSIFIAQYWGKKDTENLASTLGGSLLFGAIVTAVFSLISLMFPNQVLNIFTKDIKIVELGSSYLKIIAVGYLPMLLISIYSSVLRSTEHVKIPMYAGVFAIVLNTFLNYLLIFGKFSFPELGVYGAAYATTITRIIECVLLLIIIYARKYPGSYKITEMSNISLSFMKKMFIVMSPLLLNEFMWALGENLYSVIYGRIGTSEFAAMTLTFPIQGLCIGFFSGLSSAAGVMVGNKLGAGDKEEAFKFSKKFIKLGIVGSSLFGVLLIICSNLYVSFFNVSDDLKSYTIKLLIMFSVVMWIKVSNMIMGGGILRSGGETKYTLYLDMIGTWGVGVPLGFIAAFLLKLPIHWVYLIISFEEFIRFLIGLKIMHSKKWMKDITEGESEVKVAEAI